MLTKNSLYKKAAFFIAAFFILTSPNAFSSSKEATAASFDELKKNVSQLLLKKQKSEAIRLILKFSKTDAGKNQMTEINEFLAKVSQTFLSKEAQDAYEGSINATLENSKEAQKLIDTCLSFEPENMDCLVQKIRLSYREKNRFLAERHLKNLKEFAGHTTTYFWIELFLQKEASKEASNNIFKDKIILKRFSEKPNEEMFILTILEIERSFAAKNFSRAKSGLEILERHFPEYPENIYFKQKLDTDSSEEKSVSGHDLNVLYSTKCKGLSKTMARKFRYDFDLCQRGHL